MRAADGKAEKRPAGKVPSKSVGAVDKKRSKSHHGAKGHHNFRSSVKRILKQNYHGSTYQVSAPVVEALCNITNELIDEMAKECSTLAKKVVKQTINLEEVVSAANVILTGELKTHALKDIKEAVAKVPVKASK
jgi:histone H3/H4